MNVSRPLCVLHQGLVYLLLAMAPLGGMRMVCVDDPVRPVHDAMRAAAAGCDDACALTAAPGGGMRCSLNDGDPLLGLAAFDALPPPAVAAMISCRVSHSYPDVRSIYREPVLPRFVPPPEV